MPKCCGTCKFWSNLSYETEADQRYYVTPYCGVRQMNYYGSTVKNDPHYDNSLSPRRAYLPTLFDNGVSCDKYLMTG